VFVRQVPVTWWQASCRDDMIRIETVPVCERGLCLWCLDSPRQGDGLVGLGADRSEWLVSVMVSLCSVGSIVLRMLNS